MAAGRLGHLCEGKDCSSSSFLPGKDTCLPVLWTLRRCTAGAVVKALLGKPASDFLGLSTSFFLLWIWLPTGTRSKQVMAQVTCAPVTMWETSIKSLASGFGLVQLWLLQVFGK